MEILDEWTIQKARWISLCAIYCTKYFIFEMVNANDLFFFGVIVIIYEFSLVYFMDS